MRTVRKLLVGTTAAVGLLTAMATPASAEDLPVSGAMTGVLAIPGGSCVGFIPVQATGTDAWTSLGDASYVLQFCTEGVVMPGEQNPVTNSTMSVTTDEGTLSGDLTGWVMTGGPFPNVAYELEWTITGGTGRFDGATGQLSLAGLFIQRPDTTPPFELDMEGTIEGTVTIPNPTPTSRDDCKDGGWRHVADENGDPFRNQGHCIAWVNRNT